MCGQLAPVMNAFVAELPFADGRLLGTGLVRGVENAGSGAGDQCRRSGSGLLEKVSSSHGDTPFAAGSKANREQWLKKHFSRRRIGLQPCPCRYEPGASAP